MKTAESIQKTARFAGAAYFIIIITSVLSFVFGPYKLMVDDNIAITIENIYTNQTLYRMGMVYEILMYAGVIVLSVALYQLLKTIHQPRALTALMFRFGEAMVGMLTVVGSIVVLYLVNGDFERETTKNAVMIILEIKDALMSILMVFIGLGSVLYFSLFYKSRFIPRWLSVFGILTFTLVMLESLVLLLHPMKPWVIPGSTAILFEIIIGLWLMIKGVRVKEQYIHLNKRF